MCWWESTAPIGVKVAKEAPLIARSDGHRILAFFEDGSEVYITLESGDLVCTCDLWVLDGDCVHSDYVLDMMRNDELLEQAHLVASVTVAPDADIKEVLSDLISCLPDPQQYRDAVLRYGVVAEL